MAAVAVATVAQRFPHPVVVVADLVESILLVVLLLYLLAVQVLSLLLVLVVCIAVVLVVMAVIGVLLVEPLPEEQKTMLVGQVVQPSLVMLMSLGWQQAHAWAH